MGIRIIQWNIKHNSDSDYIAKFLVKQIQGITIVQLQEVTVGHYQLIHSVLKPSASVHSLSMRPRGKFEGKNRELGVATFVFGGELLGSNLLNRSVFPERTLVTELLISDKVIRTLNFHSLTGVGYKQAKSSNFSSIADYLYEYPIDFFSCDANEPSKDAFVEEDLVFFDNGDKGKCASLLFGVDKVHTLRDVWRTHQELILLNQGSNLNAIELPISYVINNRISKRYDFIFASADWKPKTVKYLFDESIAASSDHSMVIADLISV